MCHNNKLFLTSFFQKGICKLPDLAGGDNTIHTRHIYIHNNKPISINIPLNPLLTLHQSLLPTNSLISNQLILSLKYHLQNFVEENAQIKIVFTFEFLNWFNLVSEFLKEFFCCENWLFDDCLFFMDAFLFEV